MEVPERPGMFVVGDAAAFAQDGRPLRVFAQVAINKVDMWAAGSARIQGRAGLRPFRYFDKGNMAIVGRNFALLESRRVKMSGYLTWLVWDRSICFLPQMQSRLRVAGQWLWWCITDQRSSLLLQETGRVAPAAEEIHSVAATGPLPAAGKTAP